MGNTGAPEVLVDLRYLLFPFETTAIVENRVNLMSVTFSYLMIQSLIYI